MQPPCSCSAWLRPACKAVRGWGPGPLFGIPLSRGRTQSPGWGRRHGAWSVPGLWAGGHRLFLIREPIWGPGNPVVLSWGSPDGGLLTSSWAKTGIDWGEWKGGAVAEGPLCRLERPDCKRENVGHPRKSGTLAAPVQVILPAVSPSGTSGETEAQEDTVQSGPLNFPSIPGSYLPHGFCENSGLRGQSRVLCPLQVLSLKATACPTVWEQTGNGPTPHPPRKLPSPLPQASCPRAA